MEKKLIGSFKVDSGCITASDPCHKADAWCAKTYSAKNGVYNVYLTRGIEDEEWGERNWELEIVHEEHDNNPALADDFEFNGYACVDSGTFGFFDKAYYDKYHTDKLNEDWYEKYILEVSDKANTDIDDKGVWCRSGYGDGAYDVYGVWRENVIIALKVVFIEEVDEDDGGWVEVDE